MKRLSLLLLLAMAYSGRAWAQSAKAADPGALDAVLKKMDAVAANFTTAQANFEWEAFSRRPPTPFLAARCFCAIAMRTLS